MRIINRMIAQTAFIQSIRNRTYTYVFAFALLITLMPLASASQAEAQVTPMQAKTCQFGDAGGLIMYKWRTLGGPTSGLGCPLSPGEDNVGNGIATRAFEHGEGSYKASTGPQSALFAWREGTFIYVWWGDTWPFNYDRWQIGWDINGQQSGFIEIHGQRTQGSYRILADQLIARYTISVRGCDDNREGDQCRQGWMQSVNVPTRGPAPSKPKIQVSNPNNSSTFHITGQSFNPGTTVYIRIVVDNVIDNYFDMPYTRARTDGSIDIPLTLPLLCKRGTIHFSASDMREDQSNLFDKKLWSNTYNSYC